MKPTSESKTVFLENKAPRILLVISVIVGVLHFLAIAFFFPHGNELLFFVLMLGQTFLLWQALTFVHTIWNTDFEHPRFPDFAPPVDVFITVAGEPVDIVENTARAALAFHYPNFSVHLLNDGYVAKKDNWEDIEILAKKLGINCITRKTPGGAKAGNINNALQETTNPFVAIFDADHIPHSDFLKKTVTYMGDERMGFVQTPQYYSNLAKNFLTRTSWEQQELFFGPICKGKNRLNAVTMCGTNMLIRRAALEDVGGMNEASIAEDFITGAFMHSRGWKSSYVPEVLAEGLAPEDFLSYHKQQFRWARGALDVIFRFNIFFRPGLTLSQRIQYLSSASFFLSGTIVLLNTLLPIIFLYTGAVSIYVSTMVLAGVLIPYMFLTLYVLQRTTNSTFTFSSLAFAMGGFFIHLRALVAALSGQKSTFSITSKTAVEGNFIRLVTPHLGYAVLLIGGIAFAVAREGWSASVINNIAWALVYLAIFAPFIYAALPSQFVKRVVATAQWSPLAPRTYEAR